MTHEYTLRERPAQHIASATPDTDKWYTPMCYINSARSVMGSIDVDPASSDDAQARVQATTYFTAENSGLDKEWTGNVFMNPPYSRALIKEFTNKMVKEVESGSVHQAVAITNNGTETQWCQALLSVSSAILLHSGRIQFENGSTAVKEKSQNTKGQIIYYIGSNVQAFTEEFSQYGTILTTNH